LLEYVQSFRSVFAACRGVGLERAREYVSGLLVADKGNMLRMEEAVGGADEQALQHFLSNSTWDETAVMAQVARDVDRCLGGQADSCLILDESGFPKKGEHSVGVARQYCGQVGKVDNCQVAVFGVLNCGDKSSLVDGRLYLPKEWIEDRQRCRKAHIPAAEYRTERTKHSLALEIVKAARARGLRYRWVGCDAFYGKNPAFLRALQAADETFVADVHKNQVVFLEDPCRTGVEPKGIRVDEWTQRRPSKAWKRVEVRSTTKGLLRVEVLHQAVWVWDGREKQAQQWRLLVRREVDCPTKIAYVLSNAGPDVTVRRLAYMQAQRYWVERVFEDAKTEAGLGDYQVRGWRPWQRHMALVAMAMAFLLQERLRHAEDLPLLSCRDVTSILKQVLRGRQMTPEDVARQMERRHRRRQQAIESAYSRQRLSEASGSS
jgi:SRSO17 transposase